MVNRARVSHHGGALMGRERGPRRYGIAGRSSLTRNRSARCHCGCAGREPGRPAGRFRFRYVPASRLWLRRWG